MMQILAPKVCWHTAVGLIHGHFLKKPKEITDEESIIRSNHVTEVDETVSIVALKL